MTVDFDVPAASAFPADWEPKVVGEWSEADSIWLEISLSMSKHFDDGHHPVDCQKWSVGARYEWTLLREEAGLTLRQLGRMLNVDSSSVSRWESGQRWPENRDYFEWLIEAGETLAQTARVSAVTAQLKRDGWVDNLPKPGGPDVTGYTKRDHWKIFFKPGGLFDRYIETGTLPAWTPSDAGLVAV